MRESATTTTTPDVVVVAQQNSSSNNNNAEVAIIPAPSSNGVVPVLAMSTARRVGLVSWGVVSVFLFSGIIFGWAFLLPLMYQEGVYAHLCTPTTTTNSAANNNNNDYYDNQLPCVEQVLRLNFVYQVGMLVQSFFTVPIGILLDRFGPRLTSMLGYAGFAIASMLFAVSFPASGGVFTFTALDLLPLASALLATSGMMLFYGTFHLSGLFPRRSSTILTLINSTYDASAVNFLFLQLLASAVKWSDGGNHHDDDDDGTSSGGSSDGLWHKLLLAAFDSTTDGHLTLKAMFAAFAALGVVNFVLSAVLSPSKPFTAPEYQQQQQQHEEGEQQQQKEGDAEEEKEEVEMKEVEEKEEQQQQHQHQHRGQRRQEQQLSAAAAVDEEGEAINNDDYDDADDLNLLSTLNSSNSNSNNNINDNVDPSLTSPSSSPATRVWQRMPLWLRRDVLSGTFVCLVVFQCMHSMHMNFYMGTVNDQLIDIAAVDWKDPASLRQFFLIAGTTTTTTTTADEAKILLYNKVLGFILPTSVLFAPGIGYLLDVKGLPLSMFLVNALAVGFTLTSAIPVLPLQFATFVLFTAFRAFFYSAIASYIANMFGFENFGAITGVTSTMGALFGLTGLPLAALGYETLRGHFFWINIAFVVPGLLFFAFPLLLYTKRIRPHFTVATTATTTATATEVKKPNPMFD